MHEQTPSPRSNSFRHIDDVLNSMPHACVCDLNFNSSNLPRGSLSDMTAYQLNAETSIRINDEMLQIWKHEVSNEELICTIHSEPTTLRNVVATIAYDHDWLDYIYHKGKNLSADMDNGSKSTERLKKDNLREIIRHEMQSLQSLAGLAYGASMKKALGDNYKHLSPYLNGFREAYAWLERQTNQDTYLINTNGMTFKSARKLLFSDFRDGMDTLSDFLWSIGTHPVYHNTSLPQGLTKCIDDNADKIIRLKSKLEYLLNNRLPDAMMDLLSRQDGNELAIIWLEHISDKDDLSNYFENTLNYFRRTNYRQMATNLIRYLNPRGPETSEYLNILLRMEDVGGEAYMKAARSVLAANRSMDPKLKYDQPEYKRIFSFMDRSLRLKPPVRDTIMNYALHNPKIDELEVYLEILQSKPPDDKLVAAVMDYGLSQPLTITIDQSNLFFINGNYHVQINAGRPELARLFMDFYRSRTDIVESISGKINTFHAPPVLPSRVI